MLFPTSISQALSSGHPVRSEQAAFEQQVSERSLAGDLTAVRLIACLCIFFGISHLACGQPRPEVSGGGVTYFQNIEDVIAGWQPNRHVFVKGEIGVGQQQLQELQEWIAKNSPHWTVVLMESASDERYRAADGREYRELDAVEHALGNGLSNRTGFGNLEHPKTGESDGAIFALFLRERKFSYFASDAQDRRGLGEAKWVGRLDQPAFRAMRNGGRILDATKDTLRTISTQLEQAIDAEAASAERAQRERQRAAEEVQRGAEITRQRINEVQMAAANFRLQQPLATGPLAAPPLPAWEQELDAISAEIAPSTARTLEQRLAKLNDAIERHLNGYASLQGLGQREQELQQTLDRLARSPARVAAGEIHQARGLLDEANQRAQAGEMGFEELLSQAVVAAQAGETRLRQESAARQRAAMRAVLIRRTVLGTLVLTALVIAAVLWLLNRRRRGVMVRAQRDLSQRETSVAQETDGINQLFVRTEEILGSREQLNKRGYEGLTQQTSQRALDYVDDLFIMSRELRRVVQEAKGLVFPSGWAARCGNLFSSSRYQQAISLVTGKPLQFNRVNGLPSVLRESIQLNPDGSLPEEISMTFEDVFHSFQQRGQDARHALNTIEQCLSEVGDTLNHMQRELELLIAQEQQLMQAAEKDRYFYLPSFFESLIPAVQKDLATADGQAAFDAVQAMHVAIPAARRKLTEAARLATRLQQARQQLFPVLTKLADEIKQLGYPGDWIDDDLAELTEWANQLMNIATERSILPEIEQVSERLAALQLKAETASTLARRIEQELAPSLQQQSAEVEQGRAELARQLNVPIARVLNEQGRDPDDWIAAAGKHLETARATLALGHNEAVAAALSALAGAAARADHILEDSLTAAEAFTQQQAQVQAELQRLIARVPEVRQEVEPVQAAYESSALLMQDLDAEGSPQAEQPQPAVAIVEHAASPIAHIEDWLRQAADARSGALVLTAMDLLDEAQQSLIQAHQRLDLVQQHLLAIAKQTSQNLTMLQRLTTQCRALEKTCQDPLIRQPTVSLVEQTSQQLDSCQRDLTVNQVARNPFEVQQFLEDVTRTLGKLEAQCVADRQAHAEATRAVSGAERQLQLVQQLVRRSQTDGIPDSQNIIDHNQRIGTLARSLKNVEHDLKSPHGNWKTVDDHASRIHIELREAADSLGGELQNASQALSSFQLASQAVYQAEQWSGSHGVLVLGAPGVHELERARQVLQQGDYTQVWELARRATQAAQAAVQQAEREMTRRRLAEQQAAEAERRRAARRRDNSPFGGGFSIGGSSLGGGGFGSSRSRGSSFGGGGSGRSSSSRSSSSSSRSSGSGFGRSGW